jgi:hypothetical protein
MTNFTELAIISLAFGTALGYLIEMLRSFHVINPDSM